MVLPCSFAADLPQAIEKMKRGGSSERGMAMLSSDDREMELSKLGASTAVDALSDHWDFTTTRTLGVLPLPPHERIAQ